MRGGAAMTSRCHSFLGGTNRPTSHLLRSPEKVLTLFRPVWWGTLPDLNGVDYYYHARQSTLDHQEDLEHGSMKPGPVFKFKNWSLLPRR